MVRNVSMHEIIHLLHTSYNWLSVVRAKSCVENTDRWNVLAAFKLEEFRQCSFFKFIEAGPTGLCL